MGQGYRQHPEKGQLALSTLKYYRQDLPPYLHDGTELGFIVHLLLSNAPLHASQNS